MAQRDLKELLEFYRNTLLKDVIPWWQQHGIDPSGAINTCIQDDGNIINHDRWLWSQWRAVWVFSKLYNCIGKKQEWLDIAMGIYSFLAKSGTIQNGNWPTLVDSTGKVIRGFDSIYVNGFAIYGLSELYRATGNKDVYRLVMQTFEATEKILQQTAQPPAWPYPIKSGYMSHGISMIFSIAYHELAQVTGEDAPKKASLMHHKLIMDQFYSKERNLVFEFLNLNGQDPGSRLETVCVPGHAIESMWFQMHIAQTYNDQKTIRETIQIIKTNLELGWDETYGGLFLAVDANGSNDVAWPHHQTKLWWPHTEALYATLLAYKYSGEPWCMDWHYRIKKWSFAHFPVAEHGEWRQKLTREGKEITATLVLPVKDPFHLPRTLIYNVLLLQEWF